MGNFMGGSAFAMAQQIADGFVLVTERTYMRLQPGELNKLGFEMERLLRIIRGDQPPLDDLSAVQNRNRRIQRLNTARMMLQTHRKTRKR